MAINYTPVQKGKHVRVWFALNGLNPLEDPRLDGYMIPDQVSFNQTTEVVKKKVPSPTQRGKFETIYTVTQSSDAEITTSLIQRMSANTRSVFVKLATGGCKFDMIWAYGVCTDPNNFNDFDKLEVFEGVSSSNYQHDTTGAFDETTLTDDVLETLELVVDDYYEVASVSGREALSLPSTIHDITFVDEAGCGDDEGCVGAVRSDGTTRMIALATPLAEFVTLSITEDAGKTWESVATDIPIEDTVESVGVMTGKVIVTGGGVTNADACYYYADVEDLFAAPASLAMQEVNDPARSGYRAMYIGESYAYFANDANILHLSASAIGSYANEIGGVSDMPDSLTTINGYRDFVVVGTQEENVVVVENQVGTLSDTGLPKADVVSVINEQEFIVVCTGEGAAYTKNGGVKYYATPQLQDISALSFANGAVALGRSANLASYTASAARSMVTRADLVAPLVGGTILAGDNGNFFAYIGAAGDTVQVAEDELRETYGSF